MQIIDLSAANWKFTEATSSNWLDAVVPGCVHADLLRHKLIPDPFFGTNERDVQWVEERDWRYACEFDAPALAHPLQHIDLVFDGLDTVAEIHLNGRLIGRSENMFLPLRLPMGRNLLPGRNRLEVLFRSAAKYIRTQRKNFRATESNDPVGGRYRIRKQQCQFGWDWGPRLVTCGLWKGVRLEAWTGNRLEQIRIDQSHSSGGVHLRAAIATARPFQAGHSMRGCITLAGTPVAEFDGLEARIPRPQLWWPSGQGAQPLYSVSWQLLDSEGRVLDHWERRIGLRTVTLDLGPGRFGFRINGRLIFAKGANWIPDHAFITEARPSSWRRQLIAARDAHMNMIRVWGGGIYESDDFYDACDELGLLVWQDHLFACSLYPADRRFLGSVAAEVCANVRRLRHHASLALWCGNNENVMMNGEALRTKRRSREYARLFLETIPEVLRAEDPSTPYIHSSPALPVSGHRESRLPSTDAHDWEVWHSRKPVEHYLKTNHAFVSEFGMQSYPSLPVARSFSPPGELNVFSPSFQNHQKNQGGNGTILDYTSRLYRYPNNYGDLAYLSQLNQASCMKIAVEHFRRQQPACLGAIYWQLNDCWPVASWSSLEFGGRWKVLHYWAARFFQPTLLSLVHLGQITNGIGNYDTNTRGPVEFAVSHDGPKAFSGHLFWELCGLDGQVLASGQRPARVAPMETKSIQTIDFTGHFSKVAREKIVLLAWLTDKSGQAVSRQTEFFTAPRCLSLKQESLDPVWKRRDDRCWTATIKARSFQHAVWLEFEDERWHARENAVDIPGGSSWTVEVVDRSDRAPASQPPGCIIRTVAASASVM